MLTSQEEAGIPVLLHTKHTPSNDRSMVIVTEDIDVFLICLSGFRQMCGYMYTPCVTKNNLVILTLAKLGSLKDVMLTMEVLVMVWVLFTL